VAYVADVTYAVSGFRRMPDLPIEVPGLVGGRS
jgi:hypothetical protein